MRTGNRRWLVHVETERVTVVSRHGRFVLGWCAHCGQIVDMWTDDDVQALAGWSADKLVDMLVTGSLHGARLEDGSLRLCANALRAAIARKD